MQKKFDILANKKLSRIIKYSIYINFSTFTPMYNGFQLFGFEQSCE